MIKKKEKTLSEYEKEVTNLLIRIEKKEIPSLPKEFIEKTSLGFVMLLRPSTRRRLLTYLPTEKIAKIIKNTSNDRGKYLILNSISTQKRKRVSKRVLETYTLDIAHEKSALRIMQRAAFPFQGSWTIKETMEKIKSLEISEIIHGIVVVNNENIVLGTVSLHKIICANEKEILQNIASSPVTIHYKTDQEDVCIIFRQYSFIVAPVVDSKNRFLGVITVDEILHIIEEEAEEDLMYISGTSESSFLSPFTVTFSLRARWILVNSIFAFAITLSLVPYTEVFTDNPILSTMMPFIVAVGGNYVVQLLTMTVRSLAVKEIFPSDQGRIIKKEILLSISLSMLASCMIIPVGFFLNQTWLAISTSIALSLSMCSSVILGIIVPITLKKIGTDPVTFSTLILPLNDIIGYALFINITKFLFSYFE